MVSLLDVYNVGFIKLVLDKRDSKLYINLFSLLSEVEDLKVQLAESERCRLKLEAQLSADGFNLQQV